MILRAVGLRKSYGDGETRVDAVIDADLAVRAGEFISIVGRSGSGKSTLLAMIGALTRPSEGEILIADERVWAMSESARDRQCRAAGAARRRDRAGNGLCPRS